MAKKYEKVKLGLPAYLTFLAFAIAIVIMVIILLPSNKKKLSNKFQGSYTKEATGQGQTGEVEYFSLDEIHVIKTCSFSNLKKQMKKDKYTYILYGDTTSTNFCLDAIELNKKAMEINEKAGSKIITIYYVDSKSATDKQKEYYRDRLKKINTDVKSIEKMPNEGLWLVRNDQILDCYSNPAYQEEGVTLQMVANLHIFSYRNEK